MVQQKSVLSVADFGVQSIGRERALVAGGIGVATVISPEMAVSYVKNTRVRVVLIDDAVTPDLSNVAGALKIARPNLYIIALASTGEALEHVDTVLLKPVGFQELLAAVQLNLESLEAAAGA